MSYETPKIDHDKVYAEIRRLEAKLGYTEAVLENMYPPALLSYLTGLRLSDGLDSGGGDDEGTAGQ